MEQTILAMQKGWIERANYQGYKHGKGRTDKCLDYCCGFVSGMLARGAADNEVPSMMVFLVSVRGYQELENWTVQS